MSRSPGVLRSARAMRGILLATSLMLVLMTLWHNPVVPSLESPQISHHPPPSSTVPDATYHSLSDAMQTVALKHVMVAPPRRRLVSDTRLRIITVQTGVTDGWCRMQQSAALSGIVVENLAWGKTYAHRHRPRWILDWLEHESQRTADHLGGADPVGNAALDDWDIVLFVDGGDSAFTGGGDARAITERFIRLNRGDIDPSLAVQTGTSSNRTVEMQSIVPLIFNAEANCYHQQLFDGPWGIKKGKCIVAYKKYNPFVATKFRYLNAGGWIGYVWAVRRFFTDVARRLEQRPSLWCDQSVIGGLLLSRRYDDLVILDYLNLFFLPTYHLDIRRDFCGNWNRGGPDDVGDVGSASDSLLRPCHSRYTPFVLHFNGKSARRTTQKLLMRTAWYARSMTAEGKNQSTAKLQVADTILYTPDGRSERRRIGSAGLCPTQVLGLV